MSSSLGMPLVPPRTSDPAWKSAWDDALYGPEGFYRRHSPAAHFRTSVHGSDLLAEAFLALVRRHRLPRVVDLGAGRGELLRGLHRLAPDLDLHAVEVAPRPVELPASIGWSSAVPDHIDGLLVAHEWLDDVPCHVVEVDLEGQVRVVHVDPATGTESLGLPVDGPGVPPGLAAWLDRWWPLDGRDPGARAEIGSTRDRAWADAVARLDRGLAVAVDYGHTRESRPPFGALRSYLRGREVEPRPDGSRQVTAAVAVDSVAAATAARTYPQREALHELDLSGERPPLRLATEDPQEYAALLARSSQVADLTADDGLGGFYWIVSGAGGIPSSLTGGSDGPG